MEEEAEEEREEEEAEGKREEKEEGGEEARAQKVGGPEEGEKSREGERGSVPHVWGYTTNRSVRKGEQRRDKRRGGKLSGAQYCSWDK